MNQVIGQFQSFLDHLKSGKTVTNSHFAIPRDHVDTGSKLGELFLQKRHYFQVLINQMYLAEQRKWFVEYAPMVFVATSFIFDTKIKTTPFVVGPSMLEQHKQALPLGMIYKDIPVSALLPYQGGAFGLTIIFSQVQHQNNAERLLGAIEGIVSAIPVSSAFGVYLDMAAPIVNGVQMLMGLSEHVPLAGLTFSVNPILNQDFIPGYYALFNTQLKAGEENKFWVKDSELCYGDTLAAAKPYTETDFVLFSVQQGTHRTDESLLPFYKQWQVTEQNARGTVKFHRDQAIHNFNALTSAIYSSPELTSNDQDFFANYYKQELIAIRNQKKGSGDLAGVELSGVDAKIAGISSEIENIP